MIYLDNAATTPPLPAVVKAVADTMEANLGNPSSAHSRGELARNAIERARSAIANILSASDDAIVFTSGATEANNLAITSAVAAGNDRAKIITTTVEHSSVLAVVEAHENRGHEIDYVPVSSTGLIELDKLDRALSSGAMLLSIQWVNNETGVIQPVEDIAQIARARGVLLHIDAAQAVGKLPIDVTELGADYVSISGHKIHGPQGVGALYVRPGAHLEPQLLGGAQEAGRRAGTENVAGIAGFGIAAEISGSTLDTVRAHNRELRDWFERTLRMRIKAISINGGDAPRVEGASNVRFDGVDGQALVARLDQRGVICSQSSACTNQRPEPSYVLRAMGLSEEEAYASVCFNFSRLNTFSEVQAAATIIEETVAALRQFQGSGAFAA